jgi:hypothetical protein
LAKLLLDGLADAGRLFAQSAKFAERFKPGLVFASPNAKLFGQGFGHQLPEWDSVFGRRRLGTPEESVGISSVVFI